MTDFSSPRVADPDTGSEDGPAPDNALSLTVDSHPGGDGGHDPSDPPPAPRSLHIQASGADPGGDGGTSGVGTDEDAPPVLAHAVEDDRGRVGRRGQGVVLEVGSRQFDQRLLLGGEITEDAVMAAFQASGEGGVHDK